MGRQYVFGYGSLSTEDRGSPLAIATLAGYERSWSVAMDNQESIPGYKYYLDPATGQRPGVCVTFLDLVATTAVTPGCVGFLLPVTSATALVSLDRRERNYDRVDVTGLITLDAEAAGRLDRVWTYMGKPMARQRYAAAAARGQAVIQAAYLEGVERAFAARGLTERYRASSRPPESPVQALIRVNDSSAL